MRDVAALIRGSISSGEEDIMDWKLVAAGLALSLGCVTPLVAGQVQAVAERHQAQTADAQQQSQLNLSRVLPLSPVDAVSTWVDMIGNGTPNAAGLACLMFSPTAAIEFAAANHAAGCAQAVAQFHGRVTDANIYESDLTVPDNSWVVQGDRAEVSGCAVDWTGFFTETPDTATPGPRPGRMTMQRLYGNGWQVTDYRAC